MESISVRRLANLLLALLLASSMACHKKSETAETASPAPSQSAPGLPPVQPAPPITGPVTPALVGQDADSITHYLHYPKDPAAEKLDGVVQFYCDITETGVVETTHALVANNDAFKNAVQTALDWGRFTPATVNGEPVRVYLGGTVLFFHQNGEPVIVVSLATQDRNRVGKLANYIQPQLVGGLRHTMEKVISSLNQGILVAGKAEVVVNVDGKGVVTGTSGISENPKSSGLGLLLDRAVKQAQFTPAYENGTPAPGGINVVANFRQF
jgi:Gram-negative bacterial TonB protein C-terminal